jgi:hypothetical protein
MLTVNTLSPIRRRRASILFLAILLKFCFLSVESWAAEEAHAFGLPDWLQVVHAYADRLEKVESDQSAIDLFVTVIGPAISLPDVASTLGAKGISPQLAKDLLIPDINKSAQRLLAALVAWQLSARLTSTLTEHTNPMDGSMTVPSLQMEWLTTHGPFPSIMETVQRLKALDAPPSDSSDRGGNLTGIALSAGRLAQEAAQQAMAEWWQLKTWKDRVRVARGQSRLCGTWQWIIHNHQRHHQEQKLSLLFPPPGNESTLMPGLTELVALGDTVYLRWDMNGHTQEDSLLFSKEGNRLEGTFVNSQGGWGSISGKRTASCALK